MGVSVLAFVADINAFKLKMVAIAIFWVPLSLWCQIDKNQLAESLQIIEECANRLSYDYTHSVSVLDGFEAWNSRFNDSRPNKGDGFAALTREMVTGAEEVSQQTVGSITKRKVKDSRSPTQGSYEYISDGVLSIFYFPEQSRARIRLVDAFGFLSIQNALTTLTYNLSVPAQSDQKISEFIKQADTFEAKRDGSMVVVEAHQIRKTTPVWYDGIRCILDPAKGFCLQRYELFAGRIVDGKPVNNDVVVRCDVLDSQEIAPGVWMPRKFKFQEMRFHKNPDGKMQVFPYVEHDFAITKIFDYDADMNGALRLEIPAGVDVKDDVSGTTYKTAAGKSDALDLKNRKSQ